MSVAAAISVIRGLDISILDSYEVARYAFELLTNKIWKRDYDLFSIDEQFHVIEKAKEQYVGRSISEITLPLLETISFDPEDHAVDVINSENFLSKLETDKALLIQIFSPGSTRCAQFSNKWKRIGKSLNILAAIYSVCNLAMLFVTLLDGVADTGVIDLADVQLATYLAEKRTGIPALVAFPPGCRGLRCMSRYDGELSVDSVTDWVAMSILSLPRIRYYSKESMAQDFLLKSKPHKVTCVESDKFLVLLNDKVKVIFFSQTGERATPFIRQAAKNYSAYATFAFVLWQEGESSLWWNMLGVESAPAIVFLKETVLPQLRSVTSKELGCDPRGFSRAGKDTKIWYCVVLVGRIQETLSNDRDLTAVDQDLPSAPALLALKQKRLTFTWLDGEAQKANSFSVLQSYCFFYINSENSYETCGPMRDITDTAQLFIVRYDRNDTENVGKQPTSKFSELYNVETDPAAQLVAKYNGSNKIEQIVQWISEIIKDGDSKNLPSFKTRTPELVPEDADSSWSSWSEGTVSPSRGLIHRVKSFLNKVHDYSGDPRVGPFLLLAALISFGSVWFKRSQVAQSSGPDHSSQKSNEPERSNQQTREPDQSNEPNAKDATMRKRRTRPRNDLVPPSMTDVDPKDAYQAEFSVSG
ncbi:hypothetical protein MTR67_015168 [Solanum verrucosum]|uniref:Uncharacterized protein n=1 Tax=Solanum verrucosum TaxID=315347 RepID=A0AAF0QFV6_SOLVR|nr:hypothetical protein MTR67_015168 [Solanum verrucosum]